MVRSIDGKQEKMERITVYSNREETYRALRLFRERLDDNRRETSKGMTGIDITVQNGRVPRISRCIEHSISRKTQESKLAQSVIWLDLMQTQMEQHKTNWLSGIETYHVQTKKEEKNTFERLIQSMMAAPSS